ncbi:Hint domain-containing protein [Acidisoma cellulosilytica]|uniref:Hint domain-containing protein n=1 Tax=Acidisoma cellulosilyticum TaxID=2802395 RepID=A0A963YZY6_9PROT|nr:Hint domain-containing protein [Acidisoma cellulosilyticum]MCB8880174.1 Hint domain-containing protein [Acidisoma cellulosilyticum]
MASSLSAGLEDGTLTALNYTSGPFAPADFGGIVFINTAPTEIVEIPAQDVGVVITGGLTSITGGGAGETVVAGSGGLTYTDITPDGNTIDYIVAGDGPNLITTSTTGTGNYQINTGAGNDTIFVFGNALVNAGTGNNTISVSGGSSMISSEGNDNITMSGTGTDSVNIGTGQATINPGSANLFIYETSDSAKPLFLAPGTGSDTVSLSTGPGTVYAGLGGNSVLIAGADGTAATGAATLLNGAASGDQLYATGSGAVVLAAGSGSETLSGAGGTVGGVSMSASTADLIFRAGTGNDVIEGGSGSDTVEFFGLRADYTVAEGPAGTLIVTAIDGGFSGVDTLSNIETLAFADETETQCFAHGTHILTLSGEVPVQDLSVGDVLVSGTGGPPQAIRWIGARRVDCHRHPDPDKVVPVRIAANAFGQGCPHRDLVLSPDHAVFAEGVLIPVKHLVNGKTVRRMPPRSLMYYHIELEQHDVVLAEGLPCESYLDTGDRAAFSDGPTTDLHPAWGSMARDIMLIMDALGVAPLRVEGPEVEAARAKLYRQAEAFANIA